MAYLRMVNNVNSGLIIKGAQFWTLTRVASLGNGADFVFLRLPDQSDVDGVDPPHAGAPLASEGVVLSSCTAGKASFELMHSAGVGSCQASAPGSVTYGQDVDPIYRATCSH